MKITGKHKNGWGENAPIIAHRVELSKTDLVLFRDLLLAKCTEPLTSEEDNEIGYCLHIIECMLKDYK